MLNKEQRGKMNGVVINNIRCHEGTVTVLVTRSFRHEKYHKTITKKKKYLCQCDKNTMIQIGEKVSLRQIAPVSKKKYNMVEPIIKEVK
jgi:ribosomal protein S17